MQYLRKNYKKRIYILIIAVVISIIYFSFRQGLFKFHSISKGIAEKQLVTSKSKISEEEPTVFRERLNENDIRTFVINLKRSPQRWERISRQLQANGFVYERLDAVDGYLLEIVNEKGVKFSGLDIKNNPEILLPNSHYTIRCPSEDVHYYSDFSVLPRTLTVGEFGVYCSHREIWLKMVKDDIPYALILEDDVQLKPNFRKRFLSNINQLPADWNIVYLSMIYYAEKKFFRKGGFASIDDNIFLKKIVTNIRFTGAASYMINLPTAKLLINGSKNFTWPIDHIMEHIIRAKKLGTYVMVPFPVDSHGGDSVIAEMFPARIDPK